MHLLGAADTITVIQTVVLGLGTVLTYLSVRLAASQFREARAERKRQDVERRLTVITDCITAMTEAAALSMQPTSAGGAIGLVKYNVLQDRYRVALAALRPVGRRLPRCEALLGAPGATMFTTAVTTALDEASTEILRVHVEGPPTRAELLTSALMDDPPSPLDWRPTL